MPRTRQRERNAFPALARKTLSRARAVSAHGLPESRPLLEGVCAESHQPNPRAKGVMSSLRLIMVSPLNLPAALSDDLGSTPCKTPRAKQSLSSFFAEAAGGFHCCLHHPRNITSFTFWCEWVLSALARASLLSDGWMFNVLIVNIHYSSHMLIVNEH